MHSGTRWAWEFDDIFVGFALSMARCGGAPLRNGGIERETISLVLYSQWRGVPCRHVVIFTVIFVWVDDGAVAVTAGFPPRGSEASMSVLVYFWRTLIPSSCHRNLVETPR